MSKIFAVAALVGAAGVASANMVDLVAVDNQGLVSGFTYDLVVTVDVSGDDWTSASIAANTDGTFFQHGFGGDAEPSQALVNAFPDLAYDSFFAAPPILFDDIPGFAEGPVWTASTVTATWFDTDNTGLGTFTIARFTTDSADGFLHVEGAVTYAATGGELFDYSITVPAPASAALLGLAGLVSRRRR